MRNMESIPELSALERALERLANVNTKKEDSWKSLSKILNTINPVLNPKAHVVIREIIAIMNERHADLSFIFNDIDLLARSAWWNGCEQSITNFEKTCSQRKSEKIIVHQRWMIRRDLPEVLAIANTCSENAWKEEDFVLCLQQKIISAMLQKIWIPS